MKKWTMVTFLFVLLATWVMIPFGQAAAASTLRVGSSNGEVWDLQYRLQIRGYYDGSLDGIYGWGTANAVRHFQRDFGLPVDGVAGPLTWNTLRKVSVNQNEMEMMAKLVYAESRGEPFIGQVGVAAVIMNRLKSPKFPKTISGIIFQPGAFTAIDDGQYWQKPDATAYRAVWNAVRGWDPTYGALYYFNPNTATSGWIWSRPQTVRLGEHIFAR